MPANIKLERLKPGASKKVLVFIAGMMWAGIGIMLNLFSRSWLRNEAQNYTILAYVIGLACALIIHHFGFLRIVDRNLDRIVQMEGRRYVFSFIPWKSYVLITVMIMTGFLLRHSILPKSYLAILYIGIGTALILSSVRYFRYTLMKMKTK